MNIEISFITTRNVMHYISINNVINNAITKRNGYNNNI